MLKTGPEIANRFDQLRQDRGTFENTWQEISTHVLGLRDFNTIRTPGEQRFRNIYDTTGLVHGFNLVAALHGMLFNPGAQFFYLKADPDEAMLDDDAFEWLERATKVLRFVFKNGDYGFNSAAAEYLTDIVFFGTGAVFVDDLPSKGPRFFSRPLGEVFIDESWLGTPDTFYRWYKMSARRVVQQFGPTSDEMVRKAEKSPDEDVKMLHLIHPAEEAGMTGRFKWRSVYLDYSRKQILREGGYRTKPWIVSRWMKEGHEKYGRSPMWNALSDCKMLNEMSKTMLKTAQKAADPPLLVPDDGVLSMVSTSPGSLNIYRAHVFKDDPIRPFPVAQNPVISEKVIAQRQQMVMAALYADKIQLLNDRAMPATQVIELEDKMARAMVSMLGRIQHEGVDPLLDRTLDIVERGGFLPPRPQSLRGVKVTAEYISPASRAQRQTEARAVMGVWAAVAQLGEVALESIDNLDPDESVRFLAEAQGVPPGILRSAQAREAIRTERAQAQAQQEQIAQIQQIAQAGQSAGAAAQGFAAAEATPQA